MTQAVNDKNTQQAPLLSNLELTLPVWMKVANKVSFAFLSIKEHFVNFFVEGGYHLKDINVYLALKSMSIYALIPMNWLASTIYTVALALLSPLSRSVNTPIGLFKHNKSHIINPALQIILSDKILVEKAIIKLNSVDESTTTHELAKGKFAKQAMQKIIQEKSTAGKLGAEANTKDIYDWLVDLNGGKELSSPVDAVSLMLNAIGLLSGSDEKNSLVHSPACCDIVLEHNPDEPYLKWINKYLVEHPGKLNADTKLITIRIQSSSKSDEGMFYCKEIGQKLTLKTKDLENNPVSTEFKIKSFIAEENSTPVTYVQKKGRWLRCKDLLIEPLLIFRIQTVLSSSKINSIVYKREKKAVKMEPKV